MKSLLIKPVGGLANRMRVLEAAYNYARTNSLRMVIIWEINDDLNASYQQCFEAIPHATVINLNYLGKGFLSKLKRKFYTSVVKNLVNLMSYIKKTDAEIEGMLKGKTTLVCEKRYFDRIANGFGRIYLETCFAFYPNEHNFQIGIKNNIVGLGKKIVSANPCNVGLHIRRGDHTEAIKESPTALFIQRIKTTLLLHPNFKFYLSTDSDDVVEELKQIFDQRIITGVSVRSRSLNEGITAALIDLYCLSNCSEIWGSKASSFSERAALINNIPLKIIADPN